MILVAADRLKLNIVTLFNALSPLQNNPYNLIVQQRLSILHRKHDVIVYLPCTVVPFAYLSFIHPPILLSFAKVIGTRPTLASMASQKHKCRTIEAAGS